MFIKHSQSVLYYVLSSLGAHTVKSKRKNKENRWKLFECAEIRKVSKYWSNCYDIEWLKRISLLRFNFYLAPTSLARTTKVAYMKNLQFTVRNPILRISSSRNLNFSRNSDFFFFLKILWNFNFSELPLVDSSTVLTRI